MKDIRKHIGRWVLGINLCSMVTSMAIMEISSWLLWVLVLAELIFGAQSARVIPKPILKYIGVLAAFWMMAILGIAVSSQPMNLDNFGSTRWALLAMAYPFAFFWWLRPKDKNFYLKWMGVASVASLYTLWQFLTGIELIRKEKILFPFGPFWRATGFFNMPLTWSALIGMVALVGLAHLFFLRPSWRRKIDLEKEILTRREGMYLGVAVALSIGALVATMTRGAWLAFGFAAIIVWARVLSKRGIGFLIGTAVVVVFGMSQLPGIGERITGLLNFSDDTYRVRLGLWRANWDLFLNHPWLGVGYGQNYLYLPDAYNRLGIQNGFISHAHSNYVQMLAGTGILGFALFLALVIGLLKASFRLVHGSRENWHKVLGLGLAGAQLQVHLGGLFENNFTDGEVNHLLILVWGLVVGLTAIDLQYRRLTNPLPPSASQAL